MVSSVVVSVVGSGALTFIMTAGVDLCIADLLVDLEMYNIGAGSLLTVDVNTTDTVSRRPVVLNTLNLAGGDLDLGSPHRSFSP